MSSEKRAEIYYSECTAKETAESLFHPSENVVVLVSLIGAHASLESGD